MEREPLLHALRRRWWIPLGVAVATVLVAGALALRVPRYQATASVVAQVPANTNDQALAFSDVATSSTVGQRALNDTHTNESLGQLQADLVVVSTRSTLYTVSVADGNAQNAVDLANAVAAEAAVAYQQLAAGTTNSVVTDLSADVERYREAYLTATEKLIDFESLNPTVTSGGGSLVVVAEHRQLQLDQQAAQNAYLAVQSSVAQARVNQVATANLYRATVLDPAVARSQKISLLIKVGFAGALGFVLGLALTVTIEYLRAPGTAPVLTTSEGNGTNSYGPGAGGTRNHRVSTSARAGARRGGAHRP